MDFPSVFSILALVWNLFQKLAFEQYWLFASSAPKVSCPDGIHSIDIGSVCNQKEELVLEKEKRVFNVFGPLKIEFVACQLFSHDPFGFQKMNMHTGMYQDFLLAFQTFKFQVIMITKWFVP